jgi:fatty aldehyde-generating acyl-ACP reductase
MDTFGFIIHPLDMNDVIRFDPKAAGKRIELVSKVLEWMPAHKRSHITGIRSKTGKEIHGYFIASPFLPHQFTQLPREQIYKKIIDAGKIAESLGAKIVGLGGFTSVVGDAGETIAKHLEIGVTSGNSYTIATALEGALEAAKLMEINPEEAHATVVGATGSIGRVCAQILSRQVASLTITARSLSRLKNVAESIYEFSGKRLKVTTDLPAALQNADIVISASSAGGGIIKGAYLRPGAVVCDVALPHDCSREVAETRDDVLVFEGGLVEVPGPVDFGTNFGYPPGIALACMAETMILTLEERFEDYSLGRRIEIEKVMEIQELAQKHGFKLAGLRSFNAPITQEEIERIKENSKKVKNQPKIFIS